MYKEEDDKDKPTEEISRNFASLLDSQGSKHAAEHEYLTKPHTHLLTSSGIALFNTSLQKQANDRRSMSFYSGVRIKLK